MFRTELILYAATFGAGLLLAVYAMLHGTVRPGRAPGTVVPPRPAFNTPVIAAAMAGFGAVGYLVAKYSVAGAVLTLVLALLGAAAGWIAMTLLMARWALRGPLSDPHEEMEELQGTVAIVTQDITADALGEIAYTFHGTRQLVPARVIGGDQALTGTEVVIEKIEGGVADVELWSVVEQRL